MKAKNHNITWLQTTSQTEIMPQYQSLNSRERGKLRLIRFLSFCSRGCQSVATNQKHPNSKLVSCCYEWCRVRDSNPRPSVYKTAALTNYDKPISAEPLNILVFITFLTN